MTQTCTHTDTCIEESYSRTKKINLSTALKGYMPMVCATIGLRLIPITHAPTDQQ